MGYLKEGKIFLFSLAFKVHLWNKSCYIICVAEKKNISENKLEAPHRTADVTYPFWTSLLAENLVILSVCFPSRVDLTLI